MLETALPATLQLSALSFVLGLAIALSLATAATAWPSRSLEALVDGLNVWSIAIPTFCAGIAAIFIFSIWLGWLPVVGGLLCRWSSSGSTMPDRSSSRCARN